MKKIKILSLCLLLFVTIFSFIGCDSKGATKYEVLSNSMAPTLVVGDKVKVQAKSEYYAGDIVMFTTNNMNLVSRIIGVVHENDIIYFICHGDNVGSANPDNGANITLWTNDVAYVQELIYASKTMVEIRHLTQNVQIVTLAQIKGIAIKVN